MLKVLPCEKEIFTKSEIKDTIARKLSRHYGVTAQEATTSQMYKSCARTVLDILLEKRTRYREKLKEKKNKKVYYLCMEFLVGRSLKNNLYNLGLQDIMQETYMEIFRHIDSLQNINMFFSWVGTIATRKTYEYIKKTRKYVLYNAIDILNYITNVNEIVPEEVVQNKEARSMIHGIIQNELTEIQQCCIVKYFFYQMKQSEIARELNISENSVKSHLLRAKSKIKLVVANSNYLCYVYPFCTIS